MPLDTRVLGLTAAYSSHENAHVSLNGALLTCPPSATDPAVPPLASPSFRASSVEEGWPDTGRPEQGAGHPSKRDSMAVAQWPPGTQVSFKNRPVT